MIDSRGRSGEYFCHEPVPDRLSGGSAELESEHLKQISLLELLLLGDGQEYVVSSKRYPVTPPQALADGRTTFPAKDYPALARSAGDKVWRIVPDAGHMDSITPGTRGENFQIPSGFSIIYHEFPTDPFPYNRAGRGAAPKNPLARSSPVGRY